MLRILAPLTAGALVMGSGSLVIAGILDPIAADLSVPVSLVGQLTPAYAIAFAIAAPILSVLAGRFDRRTVLIASLLGFALASFLGAVAPSFELLLLSRVLAGIAGAAFTPNAVAIGGSLVAPEQRGQAISLVFGGFTLAAVIGVPIGIWLGLHIGWRETLIAVSFLALVAAACIRFGVTSGVTLPAADLRKWNIVLHDRSALLIVATTMFSIAGTYAVFSYIGPFLTPTVGGNPDRLALLLAIFGASGFVGNLISGRLVDGIGASMTVKLNQVGVILGLGVLFLGQGALMPSIVGLIIWGGTVFSINTAQQSRLIAHAPELQGVLLSANASLLYVGQFLGGALGGLAIALLGSGLSDLPVIGITLVILGLLTSVLAEQAQADDAKRLVETK
jgi:predicted MFS family arabinose efflux permease